MHISVRICAFAASMNPNVPFMPLLVSASITMLAVACLFHSHTIESIAVLVPLRVAIFNINRVCAPNYYLLLITMTIIIIQGRSCWRC